MFINSILQFFFFKFELSYVLSIIRYTLEFNNLITPVVASKKRRI